MNKNSFIGLDYARRYDASCGVPKRQVLQSDERQVKPEDSLISIIYSPDPISGLPTGDLNFWVSDKVNPQIKDFILSRLMQDTSSAVNAKLPDGISDADAFALSRHSGESVSQYVERLNGEINRTLWLNEQTKRSVSSESEGTSVPSE